jgi:hypothetical protein
MKAWPMAVLFSLASTLAGARSADGRLAVLLAPNSTQPAIVSRGGELDVILRENAELRLESASGSYGLRAAPAQPFRGLLRVRATLSAGAPAGAYTLIAKTASGEDRNFRSVVVLDAPPESYRVAVWTNLRVGADPQHPDTALFRVSARINAGHAGLVLVTGDLTAAGTPEQFRLALDLLNDCAAPTLVAPGPADLASGRAQEYLGARPSAVPFGPDGYLLCPAPLADLGGEAGRLYTERRRIRATRWSIAAGLDLELRDLRGPLTVFADDPLDFVLGGRAGAAGGPQGEASPWGPARLYTAPQERGALQWFTVGPRGVAPDSSPD